MKYLFLSFLLSALVANSYCQNSYSFFVDDSLKKASLAKEVEDIRIAKIKTFDKQYAKDYKEIYNSSFDDIKKLILSKESVTDTAMSNYLQKIVNQIVQKNPELNSLKLRVIFSRTLWANAYSMGDGTIVVNAGILFYMSNEAELAFILSHELAHYYLDHSGKGIEKYITTINDKEYQKEIKRIAKQEYGVNKQLDKLAKATLFDSRKHSRAYESEADYYAFKFLRNTIFNLGSVITSLSVLDKLEDSTFFKPLNLNTVLNFSDYPIKSKWIENESSIFSEMNTKKEDLKNKEADSLKTHPDCKKRVALLKDSVSKFLNVKKTNYITSEKYFTALKEKFLLEGIEYCYTNENLSRNLYYTLQLLQEKREVPFAVYSISRCLNIMYDKQKNHHLGDIIQDENKLFEKDYNLLLRLLSRISLPELSALTYNFCKANLTSGMQYKNFETEWKTAQKNFKN